MSRSAIDLGAVHHVLAVKLSSFGDIVHVTPCLRALRHACPAAEILVVLDRTWAPLLREDPHINGVIEADPTRRSFLSLDRRRAAGWRRDPDRASIWRSTSKVCGAAPRGFTPAVPAGEPVAAAYGQDGKSPFAPTSSNTQGVCAYIAECLGIAVPDLEPRLFTSPEADRAIEQALHAAGAPLRGFVLANPFGTWRSKMWPIERWAALIARIRDELAVPVVIAGGPGEQDDAAHLVARLAAPAPSLAGRRRSNRRSACIAEPCLPSAATPARCMPRRRRHPSRRALRPNLARAHRPVGCRPPGHPAVPRALPSRLP